jgi:hypothetical protein
MKNLQKEVAALESKLDYYETEFDHLNVLLKKCGFPKGINTLKESAYELLEEDLLQNNDVKPIKP